MEKYFTSALYEGLSQFPRLCLQLCVPLFAVAMSAASEKMIRKQILVSPSTARRLERLAAARGTSASEIVRQAINAFDVKTAEAMGSDELMELTSLRLKDVIKSTRRARRKVEKRLRALDKRS